MFKETSTELLDKYELNIKYLPNVITTCARLHNALVNQSEMMLTAYMDLLIMMTSMILEVKTLVRRYIMTSKMSPS